MPRILPSLNEKRLKSPLMVRKHSVNETIQNGGNSALFYYKPGIYLPSLPELAGIREEQANLLNPTVSAALRVILLYAMRSAEYLRLTTRDIGFNDRVLVTGAKGSGSYFVYLPEVSIQAFAAGAQVTPRSLSNCTYSQLYRACVKANIGDLFQGHENRTRTHIGRQRFVRSLTSGRSASELGDCLRHKSSKSIFFYGAKESQ